MMNNNTKNTESGRIIAGLMLVAVGGVLLLRQMGFFFPHWLFTWPVILILVGIYTGVKHNFQNNSWIILLAIGGFFLLNQVIPGLRLEPYFWPSIIIAAGVLFIVRPRNRFPKNVKEDYVKWEDTETGRATIYTGVPDNSDFIQIKSVFSGVNRNVLSKNFQGGNIAAVFGGSEINFAQADILSPVIIKLEVVFGGVKLIVPPHWTIQNEVDGIFHAVDDKRRMSMSSEVNPSKVIVLKGSVVFGGVEIKSA